MTPGAFASRIWELLIYDPATGIFVWRVNRRKHRAGSVAGTLHRDGYIKIRTGGVNYFAHRLAWLYVYGLWPEPSLDHINGNPADNRMANLRIATLSQNQANAKLRRGRLLPKGVGVKSDGRFVARIKIGGKDKHLGYFSEASEAHAAYMVAAMNRSGRFACNGERS